MDSQQTAQDQQTKDFMSSFFPQDLAMDQLQNNSSEFQYHPHPTPGPSSSNSNMGTLNNNSNMELLGTIGNLINEQTAAAASYNVNVNPGLLLEQQYKLTQLQQLQQLQNQIFQQQIALISGSQPTPLPLESETRNTERVVPFHGLPTPGNSTELRAQSNVEYVSPMILDYGDTFTPHQQQYVPRGSTSAPAHIAFRQTSTQPDLDFDISPLTSPWLGAHQQPVRSQPSTSARKRGASSSGDEQPTNGESQRPSRKKQSPAIRATVPIPKKNASRGTKSASSTPLMRSTRSRKGSIGVPGDTPSPVDLSMPPPAPPADSTASSSSATPTPTFVHSGASPATRAQLTPVTPASIMNLGRLGITNSFVSGTGKAPKKSPASATASPGLKAILPGAGAGASSRQVQGNPPVGVRKTSHKAAEQKRRDSLKTTFDELRTLLPPLPLPSADGMADDVPILPGALPPRGPPKAGGEGPNKGVSKLQLLMCGNDYIRQLVGEGGQAGRGDCEVEKGGGVFERGRKGGICVWREGWGVD
ncbi:BHLH domain-containing protein [Mycena sanguinolenta]|uniref:BHLH domain-containing protein n=1 Tax=Mycena sanguinolenta TaxID=230812 RepID=A0A8H6Y3E7_9AGAR|nr:BHLH domain-containing protein [Mycena sanguinolenta]